MADQKISDLKITLSLEDKLKTIFPNIWFLWLCCVIVNIITFLLLYFKIHPGDKTLALHFNVVAGVEWYGKGKNLYFLPAVGLGITAINFFLYRAVRKGGNFFAPLTVFVSFFVQLLLLLAVLSLAQVN